MAEGYLATGRYRWNAGMFVVRPGVLLDLLGASDPEFAATLRDIAADPSRLEEVWPTLPKIALDHAVAEPAADAGRVATVPAGFGWDDIGDFDSLAALLGDEGTTRPRRRRAGRGHRRRPAWSCRPVAARSPWSASTTSSSWTPPTPCWSPPARGRSRSSRSSTR